MQTTKKIAKMLAAPIAFLLVFAILFTIIDYILTPKNKLISSFYAEPNNTIDVLFVGGSHDAAAFNPTQMWDEQGFTSYNLYSWSQPPWVSYHYVKEVLKSQKPKVVVLEAFGLLYGNTYLSPENNDMVSDDIAMLIRPSLNRIELAQSISHSQVNSKPFYRYASMLRYHSRWWALTQDDFTWAFQDHSSTSKGFGPNFTTEAFPPQTVPVNRPSTPLYPPAQEYLYKLIELSQQEDFQLMIVAAPYIIETDAEWGAYDSLTAICAENNIPFIDYNREAGKEIGFDFSTDLAEHAHVNLFGAYKISTHTGAFIQQQYQLEDRRNDPAYASWHTASSLENWDLTKARLRISQNASFYFPQLNNPDMVAFLVSRGELNAPGNQPLLEGFASAGLSTDALTGKAPATLAIIDGGKVIQQENGSTLTGQYQLGNQKIELLSAPNESSIKIDGKETRLDYDGVAVVVLDKTDGSLVQTVVFCPPENSATRTD